MKKLLLLSLVLLCAAFVAYPVDFKFGVKVGATISSVSNKEAINPNNYLFAEPFLDANSVTFTGGLISQIDLWKGFGVDPELMFQAVSSKFNHNAIVERLAYEELSKIDEKKYSTYNFALPVMLRYKFDFGNGLFSPKIFTGPVISFRLQNSYTVSMRSPVVQFDWRAGIGFILNKKFEVSGSYNVGLTNFAEYFSMVTRPEIRNRAYYWAVGLGYYF